MAEPKCKLQLDPTVCTLSDDLESPAGLCPAPPPRADPGPQTASVLFMMCPTGPGNPILFLEDFSATPN